MPGSAGSFVIVIVSTIFIEEPGQYIWFPVALITGGAIATVRLFLVSEWAKRVEFRTATVSFFA
ncbi:hypothetical protein D3C71_2213670 [compost metagenome]